MLALRILLYAASAGLMVAGSMNLQERKDKNEYLSIEANMHLITDKPSAPVGDTDMFDGE